MIVSGYVTFYQTNQFFVNIPLFIIDQMFSLAGWNGSAGRLWSAAVVLRPLI